MGNFTTDIRDIAVLIIDKSHPKYGKLASLSLHDWRESGDYHLSFEDGTDVLHDGQSGTVFQQFYRRDDGKGAALDLTHGNGPVCLQFSYLTLKIGMLDDLARSYERLFYEPLPNIKEVKDIAAKS